MTTLIIGFITMVGFVFMVSKWRTDSAITRQKLDLLKRGLENGQKVEKEWNEIDKASPKNIDFDGAMRWWDRRMRK